MEKEDKIIFGILFGFFTIITIIFIIIIVNKNNLLDACLSKQEPDGLYFSDGKKYYKFLMEEIK